MDNQIAQEGIDTYIDSEFPLTIFKDWDTVLRFFKEVKQVTDEESQEQYNKLPDVVMIYRGVLTNDGLKGDLGVSWTLDYKVANMFALRFKPLGGDSYILKGEIDKEKILFFTNAREESEVIIDPLDMIWVEEELI